MWTDLRRFFRSAGLGSWDSLVWTKRLQGFLLGVGLGLFVVLVILLLGR